MRDHLADFDDFFRPLRNYFYWEPHCFDIPICYSMRSLFDGLINQIDRMTDTASAMGQAFDDAKSDDYFYLPPEAFDSPNFQRGLKLMLSPDGRSAQFIITHDVDPATPECISHVDAEMKAVKEAVKGTPLADAKFYLGGTAATYKDIQVGAKWDLMIAAVGAITLIFMVILIITRALIASFVIVGTVVLSLAASFGLSVLVWQYLIGRELHWMTLAFSVIILLAVGSDYNLLVGISVQGGDRRRNQDRDHQSHGSNGRCGDRGRPRLRRHHGVDGDQRPDRNRAGRHHNRVGSVVRHAGGPVVDDAVDSGRAGSLVLVTAQSAEPSGALRRDTCHRTPGWHAGMRAAKTILVVVAGLVLGLMVVIAGLALALPAHAEHTPVPATVG